MMDIANNEARYITLLYRQMIRQLEQELAPLGLGPGRYLYLFALYIRDGRKQQELADNLGIDKAATTRALSRLESSGYIQRRADQSDGRVTRVFLTERGQQLRPHLEQVATLCIDQLTAPLAGNEREEMRRLLAKIALPLAPPPDTA